MGTEAAGTGRPAEGRNRAAWDSAQVFRHCRFHCVPCRVPFPMAIDPTVFAGRTKVPTISAAGVELTSCLTPEAVVQCNGPFCMPFAVPLGSQAPWAHRPLSGGSHPAHSHASYLPPLVPKELPRVLDDLLVRQPAVGLLLAQGEHLPQRHAKSPDVAGGGELALQGERGRKTSGAET